MICLALYYHSFHRMTSNQSGWQSWPWNVSAQVIPSCIVIFNNFIPLPSPFTSQINIVEIYKVKQWPYTLYLLRSYYNVLQPETVLPWCLQPWTSLLRDCSLSSISWWLLWGCRCSWPSCLSAYITTIVSRTLSYILSLEYPFHCGHCFLSLYSEGVFPDQKMWCAIFKPLSPMVSCILRFPLGLEDMMSQFPTEFSSYTSCWDFVDYWLIT